MPPDERDSDEDEAGNLEDPAKSGASPPPPPPPYPPVHQQHHVDCQLRHKHMGSLMQTLGAARAVTPDRELQGPAAAPGWAQAQGMSRGEARGAAQQVAAAAAPAPSRTCARLQPRPARATRRASALTPTSLVQGRCAPAPKPLDPPAASPASSPRIGLSQQYSMISGLRDEMYESWPPARMFYIDC